MTFLCAVLLTTLLLSFFGVIFERPLAFHGSLYYSVSSFMFGPPILFPPELTRRRCVWLVSYLAEGESHNRLLRLAKPFKLLVFSS